ncbi:MAG: VOC family protein [Acidobacteriota bacterium]|nr:VOC family protein [Acidobacteriota bacterium]
MEKKRAASGVPGAVDTSGEPITLSERNGFEIYPMPMFATLAVADVAAVAHWYVQALGFGIVFQMPAVNGQPSLVHLRRRKYQDLLLTLAHAGAVGQAPTSLTLSLQTEDVDALAAQARAADSVGVSAIEGPIDTPWNTRDLRVTDPAGHRLVFTSLQVNPDPKQVERWNRLFNATGKTT